MIRKREDARQEIRERVREGNGQVIFNHLMEKEESYGKLRLVSLCEFAPGTSIGPHNHVEDAELYFIVKGEMTITDDGVKKVLHPGDVVYTGNGKYHEACNESSETAQMLAVIIE